jgi:outer membrane protein TolC
MSLDEAITSAVQATEVVRVLSGVSAGSTGQTIYDPAITNTQVDQARAVFDPNLVTGHNFFRFESPSAIIDPGAPFGARIVGTDSESYNFDLGVVQQKASGGTARLNVNANPTRIDVPGLALNPSSRSSLDLSFTQPLLQGAGRTVNQAPIIIARIDTERSYFQLKDSVQELVRSVIDGYWGLVAARTELWARQRQIEQAEFAFEFFDAQRQTGRADLGDTAQAAVSLANFRANLIATRANLLNREAAFRNVLGLPPGDDRRIEPTTAPLERQLVADWESLLINAEANRPDIIELKLILEADQQRLLLANNQALPQLDATALYRWNGLEGETPAGPTIRTRGGQFTEWQMGVNFSVPLGLRAGRAQLRQLELVIARDRALLDQQMHAVEHSLAQSLRNLEQLYAQYEAFHAVREASKANLDRQMALFRVGGVRSEQINYLNVLQAITDWGNSVTAEAQSLTAYNAELATLQREQGVILENHGIRFLEERYGSIGPLGRLAHDVCYPRAEVPQRNAENYGDTGMAAEESFNLKDGL